MGYRTLVVCLVGTENMCLRMKAKMLGCDKGWGVDYKAGKGRVY